VSAQARPDGNADAALPTDTWPLRLADEPRRDQARRDRLGRRAGSAAKTVAWRRIERLPLLDRGAARYFVTRAACQRRI